MVKKVQAALKPFKGIEVDKNESVPWNTLTAFIKEATEKRGLILPLDKLGATQGMIVEWKERKDGPSQKEGTQRQREPAARQRKPRRHRPQSAGEPAAQAARAVATLPPSQGGSVVSADYAAMMERECR
jgi:hypothetical protein